MKIFTIHIDQKLQSGSSRESCTSCCRRKDSLNDFRARENRPGNQALPSSSGHTKIALTKTDCLSFAKAFEINGYGGNR